MSPGYTKENEYVHGLKRNVLSVRRSKRFRPDSVLWLAYVKVKTLLRCALTYSYELLVGHRQFLQLLRLRNTAKGRSALVLGNGPSLASMGAERLAAFIEGGGDVFGVNLWSENQDLRAIPPTYLAISDPNTLRGDRLDETMERLKQYLLANPSIKILCPIKRCKDIGERFGAHRVIGFCDSDLRYWSRNISPLLPRGYISMTLYKALSVAAWLGYDRIYVLGMDNTYPRNVYCDRNNRILNLEVHAGTKDYTNDIGDLYGGVGDLLHELAFLFYDAKKFAVNKGIRNLDPYSLTDAFVKTNIEELRPPATPDGT